MFEQRPEDSDSNVSCWGRALQAEETASAKVLRRAPLCTGGNSEEVSALERRGRRGQHRAAHGGCAAFVGTDW